MMIGIFIKEERGVYTKVFSTLESKVDIIEVSIVKKYPPLLTFYIKCNIPDQTTLLNIKQEIESIGGKLYYLNQKVIDYAFNP